MSQYPPHWQNPQEPQPNTNYPSGPQWPPQQQQWQQPPGYPPPYQQPPPKKKMSGGAITAIAIVAIVAVLSMCGLCGYISTHSPPNTTTTLASTAAATPTDTPAPTDTPTPSKPLHWTTVQTFSGNGDKTTGTFAAPGDWKILWSCQGFMDGSGINGLLTVAVYGSDNSVVDFSAVYSDCKAGGTSTGETEEHQGGQVYLKIGATGNFSIQVQELQ